MSEYSSRVIPAWLECFPEKSSWCRNEQVCIRSYVLQVLIKDCVAPAVKSSHASPTDPSLQKMFRTLESGLGYQYHASWGLALHVIAVFFEVGTQIP